MAQQSPGQNPHRVSAREMLERSAAPATGPNTGPSTTPAPGPRSKRASPWVDKRFSVIQEEAETGSRETLLE